MSEMSLSLEEISTLGEKFYNEHLKNSLEESHRGQYAVIDVEGRDYEIDADRLLAVEKAQKRFGQKLFYIIQVGASKNPDVNFYSRKDYAWNI
jgi:hypothetical protein